MITKSSIPKEHPEAAETQYPCLCASIRKAARTLTKRYDLHLKSSGLKITQYSMLMNIHRNPGITICRLSEILQMDQTTVTRNLRVLEKSQYIRIEHNPSDQRTRMVHLTNFGDDKLNEVKPLWSRVQKEVEERLGNTEIKGLLDSLEKVME